MPPLAAAFEERRLSARAAIRGTLVLWHLCSLDAPTVAVTWCIALAAVAGVSAPHGQLLLLALGTWVVYVLDRLLDALALKPRRHACDLRERHYFHRRHARPLLGLCAGAAAALACLAFQLSHSLLEAYFVLALPVGGYTCLVHLPWARASRNWPQGLGDPVKEAAVAVLFTAAVAAPAWTAAPPRHRSTLLALLATSTLLALLCWLNCAVIGLYESAAGVGPTRALTCRWSQQRNRLAFAALSLACVALVVSGILWHTRGIDGAPAAPAAILLSSVLLLAVVCSSGANGAPLHAHRVRILADLALLTPLLFLRVGRL